MAEEGDQDLAVTSNSKILVSLVPRYAFGCNNDIHNSIFLAEAEDISTLKSESAEFLVYAVSHHVALFKVQDKSMHFLRGKYRKNCEILSISVSPNMRFIALSEKSDIGSSYLNVYNVSSSKVLRNVASSSKVSYRCCTFSSNSKFLAYVTETDEYHINVLEWFKGSLIHSWKLHVSPDFRVRTFKLQFHPDDCNKLTTSGVSHMSYWIITAEDAHKSHNLLSQKSDGFVVEDHCWITSEVAGAVIKSCNYKVVAVTSSESVQNRLFSIYVYGNISSYPFFEMKQVIEINSELHHRICTVCAYPGGFCVGGGNETMTTILFYGKSAECKSNFIEVATVSTDNGFITSLIYSSKSEMLFGITQNGEILRHYVKADNKTNQGTTVVEKMHQSSSHNGTIISADAAVYKPYVATVGEDRMLKLWNYVNWECQIEHLLSTDPSSVSFHPDGFSIAVGSKDGIHIFQVLNKYLRFRKHLVQKNVNLLKYSNGGHLLACATGFAINIFSTFQWNLMHSLIGHVSNVSSIIWGPDDYLIYSTGYDGNVYLWKTRSQAECSGDSSERLEHFAPLCRRQPYSSLSVLFVSQENSEHVIVASDPRDSYFRIFSKRLNRSDGNNLSDIEVDSDLFDVALHCQDSISGIQTMITCNIFAQSRRILFCGMGSGSIRAYLWPICKDIQSNNYFELKAHNKPVQSLALSPDERYLFSFGLDGVAFCFVILNRFNGIDETRWESAAIIWDADTKIFDMEAILIGDSDLRKQAAELFEAKKSYAELKSESEYKAHFKENDWNDKYQQMEKSLQQIIEDKCDIIDSLQEQICGQEQNFIEKYDNEVSSNHKVVAKIEEEYEHRLAVELDRYDKLSEDFERSRQLLNQMKNEQLTDFQQKLQDIRKEKKIIEDDLNYQIQMLKEQSAQKEKMYKEMLQQQEEEYEKEIKLVMVHSGKQIDDERTRVTKLEQTIEIRRGAEEQLKKRVASCKQHSAAREVIHLLERGRREKLEENATQLETEVTQKNLLISENERIINELNCQNLSLDHFRYVLDNRIQELTKEREPLSASIESLKLELRTSTEKFKQAVKEKENTDTMLDLKSMKEKGMKKEIEKLKCSLMMGKKRFNKLANEVANLALIDTPQNLRKRVNALNQSLQREDMDEVYSGIRISESFLSVNRRKDAEKSTETSSAEMDAYKQRIYLEKKCTRINQQLQHERNRSKIRERKNIRENQILLAEYSNLLKERSNSTIARDSSSGS